MEYFMLFIGLGFFLFVMFIIERADDKRYERKVNEMREFGTHEQRKLTLIQRLTNRE
jgi:hypothetical protein